MTMVEMAVWTLFLFGLPIRFFRRHWSRSTFWLATGKAFGAHVLLLVVLLLIFHRIPPLVPVLVAPFELWCIVVIYEKSGFPIWRVQTARENTEKK
ncbi:MAG: hypothetical protein DMG61_23685 [Acidobacteria bacterium]|nr:MAG: hypothetical protein DMG61_23685 [Acidobacteriota bacterium]PYY13670.1 MAG: hypothetical protein DMG60_21470 [Acidobacteriota bacterium]